MIREIKNEEGYIQLIAKLSFLSLLFGILHSILESILTFPFYTATLALLFHFEKPQKRILSCIIPLINLAVALIFAKLHGLVSIFPILLALILVICYSRMKNKAEISVYLTSLTFIFLILSAYFSLADWAGTYDLKLIADYTSALIINLRSVLLDSVSATASGIAESYRISPEELIDTMLAIFDTAINSLIGLSLALSFIISGIIIKIFGFFTIRICKNGILKTFSHFIPSSAFAYFFIVIAIITSFKLGNSVFDLSLLNLRIVLFAVFFYMGIRAIQTMLELVPSKYGFLATVIFAFLLMPSVSAIVTAFLGAFFTIANAKAVSGEKQQ